MKYILTFYFLLPVFTFAQNSDSADVTHLPAENIYECVDNIYGNPGAVKILLNKLINDKDRFKEVFHQIINDPEMKNTVKEIRELLREDRGFLDSKKNTDINKAKNEMTFNAGFYLIPEK